MSLISRSMATVFRTYVKDQKKQQQLISNKHPNTSSKVMFWGCFTHEGPGALIPIKGMMNSDIYSLIGNKNRTPAEKFVSVWQRCVPTRPCTLPYMSKNYGILQQEEYSGTPLARQLTQHQPHWKFVVNLQKKNAKIGLFYKGENDFGPHWSMVSQWRNQEYLWEISGIHARSHQSCY